MSARKYLRTLFAATALWVMLVPQPANAHNSEIARHDWLYGSATFCTRGDVVQNHTWHYVQTSSWGGGRPCDRGLTNTWHTQYQQYFKAPQYGMTGTYCFSEGWHQSPDAGHGVYLRTYNWDIWNWCNNGAWVNVVLTIDSWQYSWKSDAEGYKGSAFRPATNHCHCP